MRSWRFSRGSERFLRRISPAPGREMNAPAPPFLFRLVRQTTAVFYHSRTTSLVARHQMQFRVFSFTCLSLFFVLWFRTRFVLYPYSREGKNARARHPPQVFCSARMDFAWRYVVRRGFAPKVLPVHVDLAPPGANPSRKGWIVCRLSTFNRSKVALQRAYFFAMYV